MDIMTLLYTFIPLVASSEDDSGAFAAPLLLLASGFVFYFYVVSRYRNADKRHSHERETKTSLANLMVLDQFITQKKGLKNSAMKDSNHTRVEGAQNEAGSTPKALKMAQQFMSDQIK